MEKTASVTISGGYDLKKELSNEISQQREESAMKEVQTTFTAPPGKKIVVYQPTAKISAKDGEYTFRAYDYIIEETPTKQEDEENQKAKDRLFKPEDLTKFGWL